MIEISADSLEERIIKLLQKTYPITLADMQKQLHVGKSILLRTLQKLQTRGIIRLDQLPGTVYIRLLRNDFSFVGRKHQKKPVKHRMQKKKTEQKQYDGIMYS